MTLLLQAFWQITFSSRRSVEQQTSRRDVATRLILVLYNILRLSSFYQPHQFEAQKLLGSASKTSSSHSLHLTIQLATQTKANTKTKSKGNTISKLNMMRYNFVLPNLSIKNTQLGKISDEVTPLPANFTPSSDDVMCGRGKKCYEHNERFRAIINTKLDEYSSAPSKPEKSRIVSSVFDEITCKGQFVRMDTKTKRWVAVPEGTAREKISQGFRDCLTDQYRSSKDCRQRKRKQAREELKSCEPLPEERAAKKVRSDSPPTLVKTSDALQQLLAFSRQMSSKSVEAPSCGQESTIEPVESFSESPLDLPFHPVQRDSFRASRRFCGSITSISSIFDSEEFVALGALSA